MIVSKGRPIDSLAGFEVDSLRFKIRFTPSAKRYMTIEEPNVDYTKIDAGKYRRTITSVVSFVDTTEMSLPIHFQDTIRREDLRTVRKSAPLPLRGTDPRWVVKYLAPAALIGTGIAGIISLFYFRS